MRRVIHNHQGGNEKYRSKFHGSKEDHEKEALKERNRPAAAREKVEELIAKGTSKVHEKSGRK